ncbi:MAG TPA: hypothetical protein VF756_18940 [Thermoanaerobaculia bacterium]
MILYLDTSSLVKLYIEESGSPEVERLVGEASRISMLSADSTAFTSRRFSTFPAWTSTSPPSSLRSTIG